MDIIENGLARAREGLGQTLHHIGVLDGHRRETSSRFRGCGKVAAHIAIGRCVGKPAPVRYAFALCPEPPCSRSTPRTHHPPPRTPCPPALPPPYLTTSHPPPTQ